MSALATLGMLTSGKRAGALKLGEHSIAEEGVSTVHAPALPLPMDGVLGPQPLAVLNPFLAPTHSVYAPYGACRQGNSGDQNVGQGNSGELGLFGWAYNCG